MIAKAVKGKGFRGALNYDLTHEKGYLLDTNMSADKSRELAAEFGEIRRLRPNLNKAVLHVSLSAAPDEKLSDEQWREIGREYLRGMGLDNNQYVMTRHTDTEHEHIHILANRIRFDGQVTTDSHDYRRQEVLMRKIEKDYALQQLEPSLNAERKAPTKDEIECAIRTGEPSTRQQLQQLCDGAAKDCHSMSQYIDRLEHIGVQVVPVLQLEGEKLSGLSYRLDEVTMKGSDLGRGYTPSGLNKRGIEYEKNRDFETVSRARERAEDRALSQPDRSLEPQQAAKRGSPSRDAGTLSPGDGSLNRRDTQDLSRHSSRECEAGARVQDLDGQHHAFMESSRQRVAERSTEPARGREQPDVDALHAHDSGRYAFSDARDRIMALAGTATQSRDRHTGVSSGIERGLDRTHQAVEKQIEALGVEQFDILLTDKNNQKIHKTWHKFEFRKGISWLKRMNARGYSIEIKPHGNEHGLVLVEKLSKNAIQALKEKGWEPTLTLETSKDNYQAWIKLSKENIDPIIRESFYRNSLKQEKIDQYGLLAGFTNQEIELNQEGLKPYVFVHENTRKVAKKAPDYVQKVEQVIENNFIKNMQEQRLDKINRHFIHQGKSHDAEDHYLRMAKLSIELHEYEKPNEKIDYKKMDWDIAIGMAESGRFHDFEMVNAIVKHSLNIKSKDLKNLKESVTKMVQTIEKMPEVQEMKKWNKQKEIDRERTRSRGRGR
jgi:hypothetical protein